LAGAGEDIGFDCALVEKFGSRIRIVDPTPRAIAHFEQLISAITKGEKFPINKSLEDFYTIDSSHLSRIQFLPFGLAGEDKEMKFYYPQDPSHVSCSTLNLQKTDKWFNASCYRLATLMIQQGDQALDLLKMDIEGGEYAVIDDLLLSGLLPHYLLIEFDEAHTPLDGGAMDRMKSRIRALENSNMRCIALDGCNATFQHWTK
jgi:FkbM family methyltransferase